MSFVTISVPPATYARLPKPALAGKSRLHGAMTQRVRGTYIYATN